MNILTGVKKMENYKWRGYINEILNTSTISVGGLKDWMEAKEELNDVYTKAYRVDECEKKVKAFDYMRGILHEIENDIFERERVSREEGYYTLGKELAAILNGEIDVETGENQ